MLMVSSGNVGCIYPQSDIDGVALIDAGGGGLWFDHKCRVVLENPTIRTSSSRYSVSGCVVESVVEGCAIERTISRASLQPLLK